MRPSIDPLNRALGRLLLAGLIAGGLAVACETILIGQAIPVILAWLGAIDDTFRTLDLRATTMNGELMIVRVATPALTQVLGTHVITPNPANLMATSVSAGTVLQPLVLAAALLVAWPWQRPGELAVRVAVAAPLVVLMLLLDVPMMLYGLLWYQEVSAFEPERFSLLVIWADFMNAGGRFALTVAAVAIAVAASRTLTASGATRPSPVLPAQPATALPDAPLSPPARRAA
jgi:hypothetical protein